MANLSEDIQCAGSDTRPPMLDKADFASWQQRIRLYCRGKDNGVNILKSIDEGPFQMGTMRVTVAEGTEGPLNLGPERPRVYSDLSQDEKDKYNADIRATNIILQGLPKHIYSLINHYTDAKDIWDNVKILLEGSELTNEDPTCGTCQREQMMLERLTQPTVIPLALIVPKVHINKYHSSHHESTQHISSTTSSAEHHHKPDLGISPTENLIREHNRNTLALLIPVSNKTCPILKPNNQLRTSSNPQGIKQRYKTAG
ncbi:hypothetical protein Tco_0473120 [Tanacetum coccineum]